ncbi:Uncharacterized membrane protein YgaE, UPF0421/DUF939 family [Natronincola peptidivorans]|uniref:Uncharacterized membrane protein YgaE, UPF0421/DUF939 family n=1 Tax=Natronincola peptidivorans TaxID=426128 RepID=A0A1I0B5D7_9FIRM|nr:aromatic acid exporter family protein [Natronincola peptidivorans]SET01986.1 Uncharacterized membrane protein YgaE, UPF0421/DUF939 family [Natronincola peptidivorans]
MKIGLRTIKTGIAVTLSLLVSNILGIESPFYAAIAAIIVMQPTVSDSWKIGVNRLLGTMIGAAVGVAFVSISPGNPLLGGVGVIVLILATNKLNWKESISMGGVVFVGIFINAEGGYLNYALHRLLDTSVGIIVAVVVNYTIYPPTFDDKVVDETKQISKNILNYYVKTLEMLLLEDEENIDLLQEQILEIEKELELSEELLALKKKEERIMFQGGITYKEMVMTLNLEKETFQHLRNMQNVLQKGIHKEVVNIVLEDIYKVKCAIKQLQHKEKDLCELYKENDEKETINLNYIIKDIKKAKIHLKNNETINDYPTEEVVKMLVFLYNLEEALLKFNMVISC